MKLMKVSATVKSSVDHHEIVVKTNGNEKVMQLSARSSGHESSISGGELLMLSMATCFCDEFYREAIKRNLQISGVEIIVNGEFGAEGEPGTNFTCSVKVASDEPEDEINDLIQYTDQAAEIQKTLRKGVSVKLFKEVST
ncbi:MAG: OsmC family protein [Bacteroidales bacterium]